MVLILGNTQAAIDHFTTAYELTKQYKRQIPKQESVMAPFMLGVSYLRLAENENCCARHTPESCLLPIQGGGIHTRQHGSKQAIVYFTELLEMQESDTSQYAQTRWLLNLAYMTIGGYPHDVPEEYRIPPEVFEAEEACPRFPNIAIRTGLDFSSLAGGAIVDDFDNDGYFDIVVSTWNVNGQIRFLRNQQDGAFEDLTEAAGMIGIFGGLNLVQADYNNDGWVDIFVMRGAWLDRHGRHPNSLLRNNGNGTFTDVTYLVGLAAVNYPTQTAAWADYDLDGDLDLYVGNEWSESNHAPAQLFQNNGDETFTDVAAQAGVKNLRYAKGVIWGDFNGDRYPDLYISNFEQQNRLYQNQRDGTFRDIAVDLNMTYPIQSFPVWFWDYNNDGALDLYVSSYPRSLAKVAAGYLGIPHGEELARLYQGDGKGGVQEVARQNNLTRLLDPMGANFGDLDGDGFLDFYLGTGYPYYEALMPNVMYRNRRGQGFADVTTAGGFGHLQKGHGVAFADLDNDGDQDVFEQMGGAFPGDKANNALFENPGSGHHWLAVKLIGQQTNRSAIGARIRVEVLEAGKTRSIYKHVNSGGSFGCNPLRQSIGLGQATKIIRLEIYWPTTDRTQVFENVALDQTVRITEGSDEMVAVPLKRLILRSAKR